MTQTLLFPAYNFPPLGRGGAIMHFNTARFLAQEGWRIEVLSTGAAQGVLIKQAIDPSLMPEPVESLQVHRYTPPNLGPIPELLYATGLLVCPQIPWFKGWLKRFEELPPADAVLASFPQTSNFFLGEALADHFDLPLFIDFRDEFSGTRSREKNFLWSMKARKVEERLIHRAAHAFVTSKTVARNLMERYGLDDSRCTVIENGIFADEDELAEVEENRRERNDSTLRLVWLGTLSQHQGPETLIQGFRLWQKENPSEKVSVELVLVCHQSLYFKRRIRQHLGEGIRWEPFRPRAEIPELVASCDVGCLSLGGELYSYALPTKLYDYLHFGLPILAILPEGEARSLIEAEQIGLLADCSDAEQVASHIESLRGSGLRDEIHIRMRQIRRNFLFERQIRRMSQKMREVLER